MSLYDEIKGLDAEGILKLAADKMERTEDDLPPIAIPGKVEFPLPKHCGGHNFQFLRQHTSVDKPTTDIFFCTKCLAKREVPA